MRREGWYSDPQKRHEQRFWDGSTWTNRVRNGGLEGRDDGTATRPAPARPTDYVIHPVGIGLTLVGAAATLLCIFLPLAQSARFGSVADNTLIQSADAAWFVILAIWLAVLVYRYIRSKEAGWGVLVIAGPILVATVVAGSSDSLFTLYPIDPSTGQAMTNGPSERASLGIALYVAGFGGIIAFVGGWMMWRHSEPVEPRTARFYAPAPAPAPARPAPSTVSDETLAGYVDEWNRRREHEQR